EAAPTGKLQDALGASGDRLRARHNLYAFARNRGQDRRIKMLARHCHQQERVGPIDALEADADTIPSRLVAWRLMRAAGHVGISADRLENALAILPDEYAGAERSQLRLLLVHAHAPATAVQGDRGGQPGEAGPGNFCMHSWTQTFSSGCLRAC